MFAARNITLCTKDCVCLFICPTGATDTENGQIDAEKCIDGCRLCVDACPSHAIYLVHERYPERGFPSDDVMEVMTSLLERKAGFYIRALTAADEASPIKDTLYRSMALSNKVLAEDCIRETGHMIPETEKFRDLVSSQALENLYSNSFKGDEGESVGVILNSILDALVENRDAVSVAAFLCEECGYIVLDRKPEKCPQCASTSLQSI
jgi:Fe-S-cluster-containing hydrogenase component 2